MKSRRTLLAAALLALVAAIAWSARPQDVTAADRVDRIATELRCPVCQGLSVRDSPSQTAREMRDLVARRVAAGTSDDEIRAEFRRSYGDWVFLDPPLAGWTGLVWLTPLAALVAGLACATGWLRRRAPPVAAAPTSAERAALRERAAREEGLEG